MLLLSLPDRPATHLPGQPSKRQTSLLQRNKQSQL